MRGMRVRESNRARSLRADQTRPEALLWQALRGRRLGGFKFVRQEPIGPYFVDFVCRDERFIVEVDGATHSTSDELRRDANRTEFLLARGYQVARFGNDEVYRNLGGVLATILAKLDARSAQPDL